MFPVNVTLLLRAMIAPPTLPGMLLPDMCKLSVPCQSDVGVIHYKCSANVVMEGAAI